MRGRSPSVALLRDCPLDRNSSRGVCTSARLLCRIVVGLSGMRGADTVVEAFDVALLV